MVKNTRTLEYQIINEYELALLEILMRDNDVTSLIFPTTGYASVYHLKHSLSLMKKLNRMGLLVTENKTGDTTTFTNKFEFDAKGLDNLAAVVLSLAARPFSILPSNILLIFLMIVAGTCAVFYPMHLLQTFQSEEVPYIQTMLIWYVFALLALTFRAIFKTSFLQADKREIPYMGYRFFGPVLSLDVRSKDMCMGGLGNRIAYGLVGILAPMSLAAIMVGLYHFGVINGYYCLVTTTLCFLTSLLLACPFLPFDGDTVLSGLFFPKNLDFTFADALRKFVRDRQSIKDRRIIFGLVASVIWLAAWYDFLAMSAKPVIKMIIHDLNNGGSAMTKISAVVMGGFLTIVFLAPIAYILFLFALRYRQKVENSEILYFQPDSLTDDEIVTRLDRIPLFASLADADKRTLIGKMELRTYQHGEKLVRQGDLGQEFYVIVKGHTKAIYQDSTGQEHDVGTLHEGDAFGEIALIDDVPRTATIMAVYGCQVLSLQKETFDSFIVEKLGNADQVKQMIRLMHFFKRHPLLSKLDAREQADLIGKINFKSYGSNQPVIESGQTDHDFFVVYSGKLDVEHADENELQTLHAEDYFGYMKVAPLVRTCTEGAGLLRIPFSDFEGIIMKAVNERQETLVV